MDETSRAKGNEHVTLFVGMEERSTIHIPEGKDSTTVDAFGTDFAVHKGDPAAIEDASYDMSPAFISGVAKNMPNARITFDRLHIMKTLNQSVDNVRRNEVREEFALRVPKYLFLENCENFSTEETARLDMLENTPGHRFKAIRTLHMKESFQEIHKVSRSSPESFEPLLKK